MAYQHGIYIKENSTALETPLQSLATITVAVGTAPVNMVADPSAAVNKPILISSYPEAVEAIGYSDDWDNYTLCQVVDAFFKKFAVGPVVLINVFDPNIHQTEATDTINISNKTAKIASQGVLIDKNFIVKDSTGTTTYSKDIDYTVSFDTDGCPLISIMDKGTIPTSATKLKVSYNKLDPTKVTKADIIGGYTAATSAYKGIECIRQVYPRLNVVPGLLIAPGWSQDKEVEAALKTKNTSLNGSFNSQVLTDIDSSVAKVYTDAITWKDTNEYKDKRELALWPKIKIENKIYWYSAIMAATIVSTDINNKDVPYKSPSNKKIPISSTVLEDGTEVFLDQVQANELNANGIVTAINMAGWRTWGNNTAVYPDSSDPKDRFIAVRRIFDWWGNNFIVDFFDKVDDPTNYRLIESVVDDENIKANGYQAAGQIAGAKIEFRQQDNPTSEILNGKIQFIQKIGAFTPAENIVNVLEFDPSMIEASMFGGNN